MMLILPLALRRLLPRRPGIYVVWGLRRCLYVGRSRDVWWRWNGPTPHHRLRQLPPWAIIVFRPAGRRDDIVSWERHEIRRLRPLLNWTRVPR